MLYEFVLKCILTFAKSLNLFKLVKCMFVYKYRYACTTHTILKTIKNPL